MKLCIIGNSHLAAIKLGWDQVGAEFPWLQPQFFGARADALLDLHAEGGRLVPATPDLAAKIAYVSGGGWQHRPGRLRCGPAGGDELHSHHARGCPPVAGGAGRSGTGGL